MCAVLKISCGRSSKEKSRFSGKNFVRKKRKMKEEGHGERKKENCVCLQLVSFYYNKHHDDDDDVCNDRQKTECSSSSSSCNAPT